MRPRDWLIVGFLLAGALWAGWDRLAESQAGRFLAGECHARNSLLHRFRCTAP